ncbi:uroporphyrinogen-III synthase [Rhodovulum strictum]|uniref:Uroporphyrinogen-III synthase n=1 Tax=Rhodovulum strictum TaxID=58314 RepID=A0A844B0L2_9RHOB|nr:uroporphyrinogen-III synthase [Rhodovulum strictum]MRH19916.1 uroporphyrinogen-III synthase [Rhodovulum strictum]
MPHERPLLLLTRPRAQSARFAADFVARFGTGFDILTAPAMEILPERDPIPLDGVSALIFTSENGVAAFAAVQPDRSLHAWCVGERTADAARAAGFTATASEGTAETLVRDLAAAGPKGKLLHLRGEHAAGDVKGDLAALGFEIEKRVVYRQAALPFGTDVLARVAQAPLTLLPLFSPRSARLVGAELHDSPGRFALVPMSPAVAAAWTGPAPLAQAQAERPDADAMLDALSRLIDAFPAP